MSLVQLGTFILIAIGLSFDTFAVSVSIGVIRKEIKFLPATRVAFILAFFQALFPLIGWLIGSSLKNLIADYDHWIAFGLLTFIGIRMILEGFRKSGETLTFDPLRLKLLIWISVATSMDALVVGITFGLVNTLILYPVFIIGSVTFLAAMLGLLFGKKIPEKKSHRSVIAGGIILILIGVKILVEHLLS